KQAGSNPESGPADKAQRQKILDRDEEPAGCEDAGAEHYGEKSDGEPLQLRPAIGERGMIRPFGVQAIDGFAREFLRGGRSHMLGKALRRSDPQTGLRLRIFGEPFGEPADSRATRRHSDGRLATILLLPDNAGA